MCAARCTVYAVHTCQPEETDICDVKLVACFEQAAPANESTQERGLGSALGTVWVGDLSLGSRTGGSIPPNFSPQDQFEVSERFSSAIIPQ